MRQLTERLKRLNHRLHKVDFMTPDKWCFTDINILDIEELSFLRHEPVAIRKAYSLRYVAANLPVVIKEDELIVGCPNQNSVEFGMCIPRYLTEQEREFFESYGLSEISLFGHHPPSYDKVMKKGVIGIKEEIEHYLALEMKNESPDEDKTIEYRAMLLSLDALTIYSNRYADKVLQIALECKNQNRKNELLEIYRICRKVPMQPADSLQEAVQSYWFAYTVMNSGGEFLPLGRIDQYFCSYYQQDLERGTLEESCAMDIIGSFLIKCNERIVLDSKLMKDHRDIGYLATGSSPRNTIELQKERDAYHNHFWHADEPIDSEHNKFFGQETNNKMMTCVVGGLKEDGSDATNELSYLFIELVYQMKLLMPTLGARIHQHTPKSFIRLLAEVLRYGQGEPIIYNDEAILKGYKKLGIPLSDARQYSSDGCWETLISGKTNFYFEYVLSLKCLEWVMNRGTTVKYGSKDSIDTGDTANFKDFEEFYSAYRQQMYHEMERIWNEYIRNIAISALVAPDPLFSAIAYDCIKKGSDFYADGAKYEFRMLLLSGLADTVDSLLVIKKLVYQEKKISLDEFNSALHANWQGYERLHALIINRVEKFGNDNDYVDCIAIRILEDFSKKLVELQRKNNTIKLTGGIGTFHIYAALGDSIAASPNGRRNYDALAPNYSPVPGCDKNGPLSVIKSATKASLIDFMAGTPIDLSINKNEFEGEAGICRLINMITSFCDLDGQIISITSNSVEEFLDAKKNPEKHKNLRVRMGGLSAYFITLAPVQQDKIIERFKH
jgi:pyruvate-formate lyase